MNEHDELKDLASKVGEACSGHNNVPEIFMLVERAKLAKERKERNSLTEESDKLSDSGRFEYDGADSRLSI